MKKKTERKKRDKINKEKERMRERREKRRKKRRRKDTACTVKERSAPKRTQSQKNVNSWAYSVQNVEKVVTSKRAAQT